jgi:hypothetical protein
VTGDQDEVPAYPTTPEEFGRGLRELRTMGLRSFAARQDPSGKLVISKSQLDRYEKGQLPPLKYAKHLDELYLGRGWVEMTLHSLWRSTWDPWLAEHGVAKPFHFGRWPASYSGLVWIKIKPLPDNVDSLHHIEIWWGPWECDVRHSLPPEGVVLVTGKAETKGRPSVVCNVSCDKDVFVLFGLGWDLTDEVVVDIRRRWRLLRHEQD